MAVTESQATERTGTPPILRFTHVSFAGRGETSIRMNDFSATISAGELVEVDLDRHHDPHDLTSSLLGLGRLKSGTIEFLGQGWSGKDYARHFQMRSRIGRVFSGSAWIQSLTIRDNVLLAMLHHGVEPAAAESEVKRWCARLAGNQLAAVKWAMNQRPSFVEPSLRQLCQLVRAVCNAPKLLILERPLKSVPAQRYRDFVSVIDDLRKAGTAVLFFAGDRDGDELAFRRPVIRWPVIGDALSTRGATLR